MRSEWSKVPRTSEEGASERGSWLKEERRATNEKKMPDKASAAWDMGFCNGFLYHPPHGTTRSRSRKVRTNQKAGGGDEEAVTQGVKGVKGTQPTICNR